MILPSTKDELIKLGWNQLDVILVSGDTYIDSPYIGIAMIGRVLLDAGYKVGIIAQPDINSEKDIKRLGEPKLFWGVSGGSVDSMVANYTAGRKKRKSDDYTPGGVNDKRPDRAVLQFVNLIRRNFKNTVPIAIGGIEASLRRVTHFDFWSNKIKKSILFDSKADYLIYGMGERAILELAKNLATGTDCTSIRGLCYKSKTFPPNYLELPSFDVVNSDKKKFTEMFNVFYQNNDPLNSEGLAQKQDDRYLVQNPPAVYLSQKELDYYHSLPFTNDVHPHYKKLGKVKALDTIRFSITSHRGCYGECNFCAIAVHQGRTIRWRSKNSIITEAEKIANYTDFKGYLQDVGGPTANMYGFECAKKIKEGSCKDKRCIFPEKCSELKINHNPQLELLKELKKIKNIKKVFINSGIRYDMIINDKINGDKYLDFIVENNVSGQMKIAPEHTSPEVLSLMGKPNNKNLISFKERFFELNKRKNKKQFLTYYFIAAHPGCKIENMTDLKRYANEHLQLNPEQVQIFTPTPSTYSTLMYYTGKHYKSGNSIFVEEDISKKNKQKEILTDKGFSIKNKNSKFRNRKRNR